MWEGNKYSYFENWFFCLLTGCIHHLRRCIFVYCFVSYSSSPMAYLILVPVNKGSAQNSGPHTRDSKPQKLISLGHMKHYMRINKENECKSM